MRFSLFPHRDYLYRLSTGGAILIKRPGCAKASAAVPRRLPTECHKWVMPIAGSIGSALCSTKR